MTQVLQGNEGSVRIGLLEHSDYTTAENFLHKAFARVGYRTHITRLSMSEIKSIDKSKNVFTNEWFDVFASDISLGDTENYSGLDVIQKVKSYWPDLYVIGVSRTYVSYRDVSNRVPTFDVFVHKPMINNESYIEYVTKLIHDGFRRNVFVQLDPSSELEEELKKPSMFKEIESLIKQVTFTSHSADRSTRVSRVILEPLEGGFSYSKVYRLRAFTSEGLECVPAVFKLSKPEAAQREFENYMNYIDWYMPYTWRPELLGRAFTRRWGAVCYSFAYNELAPFTSLNSVIEAKNNSQLIQVAKKIFDPERQRWFHVSNVQEGKNLTQYYYNKWFPERSAAGPQKIDLEMRVRKLLSSYNLVSHEVVGIKGTSYKMPESFLLGWSRNQYHTCIRHGDLHGGNMLVTEAGEICFIDFQDTGRGHVFEDFVVFESSVRVQYNTGMDFETLLEYESKELNGEESPLPFQDILQIIRDCAKRNFQMEVWSNYVYALALFSYRLLRINELNEWQKQQLVACLFACIAWLEQHEKQPTDFSNGIREERSDR